MTGFPTDPVEPDDRGSPHWEADLVPVAPAMTQDPSARPAAVLVARGGKALALDVAAHPPAEPPEIAEYLARVITSAVEQLGHVPSTVHVRHEEVAGPLRDRLAALRIGVRCERSLPDVDALGGMVRQGMMNASEPVPAISLPHTWAAWGLPESVIRDVFAAAAVFYRARPWKRLDDREALAVELPDDVTWFACVLGATASRPGLTLIERLPHLVTLLTVKDATRTFRGINSMFMSLSFSSRSELPAPMRREAARVKRPVAGMAAHPMLCTFNTPGGGLPRARAAELAAVMRSVAKCASARSGRAGEAGWPRQWVDDPTGIVVRYIGLPMPGRGSGDGKRADDARGDD